MLNFGGVSLSFEKEGSCWQIFRSNWISHFETFKYHVFFFPVKMLQHCEGKRAESQKFGSSPKKKSMGKTWKNRWSMPLLRKEWRSFMTPWNLKHPFRNGCFNWMIPNHYISNCCFTKHPFKTGCLGYQAFVIFSLGGEFFTFDRKSCELWCWPWAFADVWTWTALELL